MRIVVGCSLVAAANVVLTIPISGQRVFGILRSCTSHTHERKADRDEEPVPKGAWSHFIHGIADNLGRNLVSRAQGCNTGMCVTEPEIPSQSWVTPCPSDSETSACENNNANA